MVEFIEGSMGVALGSVTLPEASERFMDSAKKVGRAETVLGGTIDDEIGGD
jgi:hypothetical protein